MFRQSSSEPSPPRYSQPLWPRITDGFDVTPSPCTIIAPWARNPRAIATGREPAADACAGGGTPSLEAVVDEGTVTSMSGHERADDEDRGEDRGLKGHARSEQQGLERAAAVRRGAVAGQPP